MWMTVLGERVRPRPLAEICQRRQTHDLAVAPQADTADVHAGALVDVGEGHELHVLHARQAADVPVVDPHAGLHATHGRVAEVRQHLNEDVVLEAPVRVDDADDDLVQRSVTPDRRVEQRGDGGVERRALALARLGQHPAQQTHLGVLVGHDDARGLVVRSIVDDHDDEIPVRQAEQPLDAGPDGHHVDDEQQPREREQRRCQDRQIRSRSPRCGRSHECPKGHVLPLWSGA